MKSADSLKELWDNVLDNILKSDVVTTPSFNLWFKDLELHRLTDSKAYITVKETYKKDIVTSKYTAILEDNIASVIGFVVNIVVISLEELGGESIDSYIDSQMRQTGSTDNILLSHDEDETDYIPSISPSGTYQKDDFTFDNFIVGSTNKFAHAACLAVANSPIVKYNPLFIYGQSGLGKTHLLYAIRNFVTANRPNINALYVRGEDFTNEYITSLSKKEPMQYFRDRYRKVDMLLVDDIQFISGKVGIQEEFFHTFNTLYDDKKQIILASDRPPKDIPVLEARLQSRFEGGLTIDIQPPDYELRLALLKKKSEMKGIDIPTEVLIFLAEQVKSNIRQLEGAISNLSAQAFLTNEPIDMKLARKCIVDILSGSKPASITVDNILNKVSKKYQISIEDIKSKKRQKPISHARHIAIYLIRKITPLSLNETGKYFSGIHYSSVIFACNSVEEMMQDPSFEREINELINDIKN